MAKKIEKNSNKTTRRATSAIWRIFAELDKPERTLSKINLTSMQVSNCFSYAFKQGIIMDNTLLDPLNSSYQLSLSLTYYLLNIT